VCIEFNKTTVEENLQGWMMVLRVRDQRDAIDKSHSVEVIGEGEFFFDGNISAIAR
jgi:hypothetical protein